MIVGAHVMLQSRNPSADKAFFGGVLNLPSVDAGGGFLIFGFPSAEIAIHDSESNDLHQLYLMCGDAERFLGEMERLGIACTEPKELHWGTLFEITLPGGGRLGVYEPRHPRPTGAVGALKPPTAKAQPKRKAAKPRAAAKKSAGPRKAKAKARSPRRAKGRR
ncbi:MAG TPA: hypothetical protein VKR31_04350 [Rhizomicrobium sp.]|nr:hypothetical protein [Rhizomicrobium sp.]